LTGEQKMMNKWRESLDRTRKATFGRIVTVFGGSEVDQETWDDLEALLIQADVGVDTSQMISEQLRKAVTEQGITKLAEFQKALSEILFDLLLPPVSLEILDHKPAVVLLVGVNGSGKTTTAAKLGNRYAQEGKKILLAAADTYRAAAIDQLQVWGERLHLPVIAGQPDSDPGAVAYDSVQAAMSRNIDILFIDTAGRLHTRYNLMEELKKVNRVVGKALPGAPHAVLLVLDATTGQNALLQARAFQQVVQANGVILTKLDSSARGGMAFAIQKELGLPIYYAGLGEKPEDLQPFDRAEFVKNILS
jgi:fused signal recognition particle receptor